MIVPNIAALQTIKVFSPPDRSTVEVLGYYAANDGGGGRFVWDATSTATADGGQVVSSAAAGTGRWLRQRTSAVRDIREWGAKVDQTTDDGPAIQAALDYGGCILVPGLARTNQVLQWKSDGTTLMGLNTKTCGIRSFATGGLIESATKATATRMWCVLKDLTLQLSAGSAPVVDWQSMQLGKLENLFIYGNGAGTAAGIYMGVQTYGAQQCTYNHVSAGYITNCGKGIHLTDGANANQVMGIRIQIGGAGGVGVKFEPATLNGCNGNLLQHCSFEWSGNTMTGVHFAGKAWDNQVFAGRFENLLAGVLIDANNKRVSVIAGAFSGCSADVTDNGAPEDEHWVAP